MRRDNFQETLTPIHSYMFYMQYDELPEEHSQISTSSPMRMAVETSQRMGAHGKWTTNSEGSTINESSMSEGPTITYTPLRYDSGYELTWELTKDDLYGVFSGKGKGGSAQDLAMGCNATVEEAIADIYNDGFSNTGYDGVALFANSHPMIDSSSTIDNLGTGVLSDTTLKGLNVLMRRTKNEANIVVVTPPKQLIVPPDLEYTANELLYSAGKAGVATNEKNTLPGMSVVVNDYLSSTTAYFVRAGDRIRNVVLKWREKPWFDTQVIQKKVDFFCYGYMRFTEGYDDFRGLAGSAGQ